MGIPRKFSFRCCFPFKTWRPLAKVGKAPQHLPTLPKDPRGFHSASQSASQVKVVFLSIPIHESRKPHMYVSTGQETT